MNDDLMQKLVVAKAIMDKHNKMPRNIGDGMMVNDIPQMSENIKYNIPDPIPQQENILPNNLDKINNSKLPDEIKKIMLEHPIQQPKQQQTTFSNEFIEKASRLMNNKENKVNAVASSIDYDLLKRIIKETVEETLSEKNILIENVQKTNDLFSFRVGKHIFEGKVTKIKKIQ